jgi:N-acetyl-anhydromuramyl-L-alanine amidase AmpD
MIDRNTVVVGVTPDLPFDKFQAVLKDAGSPAFPYAQDCYNRILKWKVSVAFMLAIARKESGFGKYGFATVHLSLGNTRSTVLQNGIVVNTVQGYYIRYKSWADGVEDAAARLALSTYIYAREGRTTIDQIITRYAPPTDGNDTAKYISDLVQWMNEWVVSSGGSSSMFDLNNIPFTQSPNYDAGGNACNKIIIHSTEGSYGSSVNWLASKASGVSAHYVISEDGSQCTQLVKDSDIAWHAGNWAYNSSAIGIEHSWISRVLGADGQWHKPSIMPSEGLYRAGAALVARLCKKHNITPDRQHIIAHGQVPPPNDHTDPGPWWDWDRYMDYIEQAYSGGVTVFDPNPKKFIVGPGVLETLTRESMTALTNEQYYVSDGNKPGLPKKSFTYADKNGVTYRVEAIQDQDANGQPLPTWSTEIWLFVKKAA